MSVKRYQEFLEEIKDLLESDPHALELLTTLEDKIKKIPKDKLSQLKNKKNGNKNKKNFSKDFSIPLELENCQDSESLAFFCDGACRGNPGPGAWAAMAQNKKGEVIYEASGTEFNTTNNRMELMAAIFCLHAVSNFEEENDWTSPPHIFVYSDSRYVVDGLENWVKSWKSRGWKKADNRPPENIDLWKELDQLKESIPNVKFIWVKGHDGHPQNEYVDYLANMALDEAK